jgi:hypothetical protein
VSDNDPMCADGCGREATTERLDGIIVAGGELLEVVELVCVDCLRAGEKVAA